MGSIDMGEAGTAAAAQREIRLLQERIEKLERKDAARRTRWEKLLFALMKVEEDPETPDRIAYMARKARLADWDACIEEEHSG